MCVVGDGLHQDPGAVPAAGGEQGRAGIVPTGLGLSDGCRGNEDSVLLALGMRHLHSSNPVADSMYRASLCLPSSPVWEVFSQWL